MKVKFIALAMAASLMMLGHAAESVKADSVKAQKHHPKGIAQLGGKIRDKKSAKGKVVFLNVSNSIQRQELLTVIDHIRDFALYFNFEIVDCPDVGTYGKGLSAFADAREKLNAGALVAIVTDAGSPAMLAAPEDGWSLVNVAKMDRNLKTDRAREKFLAPRIRRELLRAFAYACNAGGSGYRGNLMSISKLEDVDACEEYYPYDTMMQIAACLRERGVTPERETTYLKACREGWAPAPTNEIQKAIWDKVHQLPTKPIKILPETKPVKE